MQAELSMLKAQINPHFLFNTLNSIYALAIRKDEKTADAVVQLAELMRYIMNNANDNTIDLDKEINYISNYISLQRARLGETVRIDYHVNGKAIGEKITPLILISFIENAFKHGVNPDENSEIEVRISIDGHQLQLMVRNNKVRSVHNEGGIGMKNTRARLQMLYAGRHSLETRENEQYYVVELKMDL
jgi:sensor histidine kinase YesM